MEEVTDRLLALRPRKSPGPDGVTTVSYTHLDVYKRQVLAFARKISPTSLDTLSSSAPVVDYGTLPPSLDHNRIDKGKHSLYHNYIDHSARRLLPPSMSYLQANCSMFFTLYIKAWPFVHSLISSHITFSFIPRCLLRKKCYSRSTKKCETCSKIVLLIAIRVLMG